MMSDSFSSQLLLLKTSQRQSYHDENPKNVKKNTNKASVSHSHESRAPPFPYLCLVPPPSPSRVQMLIPVGGSSSCSSSTSVTHPPCPRHLIVTATGRGRFGLTLASISRLVFKRHNWIQTLKSRPAHPLLSVSVAPSDLFSWSESVLGPWGLY